MLNFLIIILTVLSVSGCSGVENRINDAYRSSKEHGFKMRSVQTRAFRLVTYYRINRPGETLYVYIEGDGNAFSSRNTISKNPTPANPVALKLALSDAHPNIVYIARPCQFLLSDTDPACTSDYWTFKRYSPEVIDSVNEAISLFKGEAESREVVVTGYSGGGAVSTVIASMRNDITGLRTVAGNLDIHLFAEYHNVTPLTGSLNPVDFAKDLYSIPQLHIVGERDAIVPKTIADSYAAAVRGHDPALSCMDIQVVPAIEHGGNWTAVFREFEDHPLKCRSSKASANSPD